MPESDEIAILRAEMKEMFAGVSNRLDALHDRLYKDNGQPSVQTRLIRVESEQARRREKEKGQRALNVSIVLVLLGSFAAWVFNHLPWIGHK